MRVIDRPGIHCNWTIDSWIDDDDDDVLDCYWDCCRLNFVGNA